MKPDFDYHTVPFGFLHCFHKKCPQAKKCLRHLITKHIAPECVSIQTLNPAHVEGNEENCSYFKADRTVRFAAGTRHLLDKVPQEDAIFIRNRMIAHFGRNNYYRFRVKKRLVNPEEQAYIKQLFLSRGIKEEPVYEEYIEQYQWE